jgi:acetyl-CoA carboxylase carboxyltransferase component
MTEKQKELLKKREALKQGGGEKAIARQHAKGKYTARERLEKLFDEGTFVETGLFVKHHCTNFGMEKKEAPGDGVVTGHGCIHGRLVFAAAQDFTVMGGSLGYEHAMKIVRCQEAAMKAGAPMICINDSGGARIQEGVDALAGYGAMFYQNTMASGVIPQISVIMGPCAGGAVYSPALTDFIFMVEGTSQMFVTGPKVVKAVTGEEVSAEELGGAATHNTISGCAHFCAANEDECLDQVKELLAYLPQNNQETPPALVSSDDPKRECPELNDLISENPHKPYDMYKIIAAIADNGTYFESQAGFARNIITCFIRLNGKVTGVAANQPDWMAGCLDIDASDKAARFIRTCDAFNIPLLTLEDVPGCLPGTAEEYGGVARHDAKLLYAYSEASVPMVTVITRKAYGGAYIGMGSKHLGADLVYAWPDTEIAVMGAAGAANIIFAKDIKNAADPEAERKTKVEEYNKAMMNPYIAAARGYVDDVILPSETRKTVIDAFASMQGKKKDLPHKKHGNIPL